MVLKNVSNAEVSHLPIRRGCILVKNTDCDDCEARLLCSRSSSMLISCINVGKLLHLFMPDFSPVKRWVII